MVTYYYQVTKCNLNFKSMKKLLNTYIPRIIGCYFNVLVHFSKKAISKKAFILFCTPRKGKVQPQQKSFLIALKLAQFDFIKAQSGEIPLLLLDDVFDKLDEQRVSQIIQLVNDENFGQLFVSDTHADRTEKAIKSVHQSYQIFQL